MTQATLEERVARMEKQVAELVDHVNGQPPKPNWIDRITGSFEDVPEFDEVVRLGRDIRQSDRPVDG